MGIGKERRFTVAGKALFFIDGLQKRMGWLSKKLKRINR